MAVSRLLLILCAFGSVKITVQTGSLTSWEIKAPSYDFEDKRLLLAADFVTKLNDVPQLINCVKACRCSKTCKAVNYEKATKSCELLKRSHEDKINEETPELKQAEGYVYRLISDFDIKMSALYQCSVTSTPSDMQQGTCSSGPGTCVCNAGWTGPTCSEKIVTPKLGEWSSWDTCTTSCGSGTQTRKRDCINSADEGKILTEDSPVNCQAHLKEIRNCMNLPSCPKWSAWMGFGPCSSARTCGHGDHTRTRTCANNGTVDEDRYCLGSTAEKRPCTSTPCSQPITLAGGAIFGNGHVFILNGYVCGDDKFDKKAGSIVCKQLGFVGCNSVKKGDPSTLGDNVKYSLAEVKCNGDENTIQSCQHAPWSDESVPCPSGRTAYVECIVNGQWSFWSTWSGCTVSCKSESNPGEIKRTRKCAYPPPTPNGARCTGQPEDSDTQEEKKPCTTSLPTCPSQ